ncbi:conserved hypothetical protein [Ancylobacter novellus DSM 506]|uniref:Transmembrane protein n=1 Tax=Ancylobacter novellus (strain ATCC 8093 / DSM 506 / JCM 20403 / CCM 1077 / IAM 12100 / NBRC 12443 / NCIMB 10456) TaxID=639283 RepID=D7A178_ANCN5|nr:hypothetical protein [Ancylobacter novellus]ADH89436.1 conserved hypothetical protein [Ancylobacter novellus DSM 506]
MISKSVLAAVAVLSVAGFMGTAQEANAWRAAGCGGRGCAAAWGPGHYYGPGRYYGPVPRGGGVVVVNPRRYWPPGGAVAAGAALGFLTGVAAANLVGPPPQPNYCWYYTNPQRTTGFWEPCP